jgi:hypothetical protein
MAKSKNKGDKANRSMLERELLLAIRAEGWLAPETEQEVLEAEKKLATERIMMPTSLDHPRGLLYRGGGARPIHFPQPKIESAQETESLARAAREGGTISSEVEERMKKDRDAAERKSGTK